MNIHLGIYNINIEVQLTMSSAFKKFNMHLQPKTNPSRPEFLASVH